MRNMFRSFLLFVPIVLVSLPASAEQVHHFTSEIDTPTAYTLNRGTYDLSMFAYDGGGLELKAFIGLHDNFYLGASFDIEHAIGKDKPEGNVPGVIGKVKFTDGWETFPISFAIGYDSFYLGSSGKIEQEAEEDKMNRMIYGPYFVITKPIYLLDSEQHISGGIRVPVQPDYHPDETSYFLSFDVPIGDFFAIKGEWEKVYYNFHKPSDWLYNLGMRYTFMRIGIEFDVIMQRHERVNRVLRVEYQNVF